MAWQFSGRQDVYIEIAEKITQYIRAGVYRAGDKLPSVRQAAGEMGVNPNTVARAYALLEERGLVHALPKKGAYVSEGEKPALVCEQCGFGDYTTFYRNYITLLGRSPSGRERM